MPEWAQESGFRTNQTSGSSIQECSSYLWPFNQDFFFPPFFSLFFCLTFNPVWARRSLLLLQSDQWTSVHHVEIRYPLKMSVRWSLAPHDDQRLEKLYIEMSFSTVNAARGERINRPDWKWSESLITISTSPCTRFTTYLFIGYSR
jgi:hypothetical protein